MHNIKKDALTGQDARFLAVVNGVKPIWANLGQIVTDAQTLEQAMQLSHMDKMVLADAPLWSHWSKDGLSIDKDGRKVYKGVIRDIPTHKAIIRLDTKELVGVVGIDFCTVQPLQAFQFTDTLAENNSAHYISAGLLNNSRMFILMSVPQAGFEVTDGDRHDVYVMFAQGFDGSMALITKLTETRVECQNTMMMALSDGKYALKIKHTKNAQARLESAQKLISGVTQDAKSIEEKLKTLAKRPLKREGITSILDRLFPANVEAKSNTRIENIRADVLTLFEKNDGNKFPEQRGTAYNLLNAVTQYVDHERSSKSNGHTVEYKRSESAMFGSGDKLKAEAFDIILQMTDGTESTKTGYRVGGLEVDAKGLLDSILEEQSSDKQPV